MRLKYIIYGCLSIFVFFILLNYNSNKEGLKNDSDKIYVKKILKKIKKNKQQIKKNKKKITSLNNDIKEINKTVKHVMQTMGGAKDHFDSVSDISSDMSYASKGSSSQESDALGNNNDSDSKDDSDDDLDDDSDDDLDDDSDDDLDDDSDSVYL